MKTQILKHKFIYFFMLLSLVVSFNACSDDDDKPETFLEKYDGTKWTPTAFENTLYLQFINDNNILFELWAIDFEDNNSTCYTHYNFSDELDNGETIKIIENSTNKLVVQIISDGETETDTFTVEDDILTVVIESSDDGNETLKLKKTSVNIDGLTICN